MLISHKPRQVNEEEDKGSAVGWGVNSVSQEQADETGRWEE